MSREPFDFRAFVLWITPKDACSILFVFSCSGLEQSRTLYFTIFL